MRFARPAVAVLIAMVLVVPSGALAGAVHEIQMTTVDFEPRFVPDEVTIRPGDTVQWINADPFLIDHATASGTGSTDPVAGLVWDSGRLAPGESFEVVFPDAGTFPYFSAPHEYEGMFGVVNVSTSLPVNEPDITASTWGMIKSRFSKVLPKEEAP